MAYCSRPRYAGRLPLKCATALTGPRAIICASRSLWTHLAALRSWPRRNCRPGSIPIRCASLDRDRATSSPAKVEWRTPQAQVSCCLAGPGRITYISIPAAPARPSAWLPPAMVGTGDPITYGRAGVTGPARRRPVGASGRARFRWRRQPRPHRLLPPAAAITALPVPQPGHEREAAFDRAEWLGKGKAGLVAADFNGDGAIDLVASGGYYSDVRKNRLSRGFR